MINRATLTGRLTRDVELRYTQSGVAAGSFTLAVDRQFTNQNNEREADFINCVIWRKSAENFANFTHKGALVGIDGHIQTRNYDNKQGQRVYVTEVVVDNFALLEPKSSNEVGQGNNNTGNRNTDTKNNNGNASGGSQDPFANNGDTIDISDDDLPF